MCNFHNLLQIKILEILYRFQVIISFIIITLLLFYTLIIIILLHYYLKFIYFLKLY